MTYIALLRGINVGGNNLLSMAELKITFEESGMTSVKTYINSGNIIFQSSKSISTLTPTLESAILKKHHLPIKVLIKSLPQMEKIAAALPEKWVNDSEMKCDVMFLWEHISGPDEIKKLKINKDEEDVKCVEGAVIWRVNRRFLTRSSLLKIIGTTFYKSMTIRNCNTVRKLLVLMKNISVEPN